MSDLLNQLRAQLSGASMQLFSDEQIYCLLLLLHEVLASDLSSVPLALSVISSPRPTLADLPPISSDAPLVAVEELPLVLGVPSVPPKCHKKVTTE